MFWKFNSTASSQIDSLLSKEDVTLQEVMDSEDIINECRVQNKILIDFLLKPEIMEELVTLTTREPSIEINERTRFKYPNIASELLTCDVPAINERLAGDDKLLEKLYVFLESESPLNPLLASYFSKIMGALIARKIEQVLDFLKARDSFLPLLIKHLGTSAVMDLMLKLMTQVEGIEMRQNSLNWLDSQRIIQQLISLLNPTVERERHDNVAQLLCDFIRIARDTQRNSIERTDPDPLLNTLQSPDTISFLLDQIFVQNKCESAIVGAIQILLALLDVDQSSIPKFNSQTIYNSNINDETMDLEQKQIIHFNTTEAVCSRLKDFHGLLLNPPQQPSIITTVCLLDPPLGNTRLQVVKLLAAIIPSNIPRLIEALIDLNTFATLLDLFVKYTWNNFLHTQVENCVVAALRLCSTGDSTADALSRHLLVSCNLVGRLLKVWKENDEQQAEGRCIRQGYMGHLISIVNSLVDVCSTTSLGQQLKDLDPEMAKTLEEFKDSTLAEANSEQEKLLAGVLPNTSAEENDEYGDIPFPQSSAVQQQTFSQYQMQNLTSQHIEGYSGFNDDAFNDGDNTLQTIDNPSDVNFDVSESDAMQRDEIFKQVCAQSINTLFDADDQIFEDKDHTFQTVIEKHGDKNNAVYSSDSDDGSPSGDDNMDVDPWSSPKPDPWSTLATSTAETTTSTGWADFSMAEFSNPNVSSFDTSSKDIKEMQKSTVERSAALLKESKSQDICEVLETRQIKEQVPESAKVSAEGAESVESAGAGDQGNKEAEKIELVKEECLSEPSIPVEGDNLKPTEKQPPSPDKSQRKV